MELLLGSCWGEAGENLLRRSYWAGAAGRLLGRSCWGGGRRRSGEAHVREREKEGEEERRSGAAMHRINRFPDQRSGREEGTRRTTRGGGGGEECRKLEGT